MGLKTVVSVAGGSIAGAVLAILLSSVLNGTNEPDRQTALMSDIDGSIKEICIHYSQAFHEDCIETYKDFLGAMPEDTVIRVVVEKQSEFDFLKSALSSIGHRQMSAVVTGYPVTPWAKDRFGSLRGDDGKRVLALPPVNSSVSGPRGNDGRVPDLLAQRFSHIATERLSFFFEGGDLLCSGNTAYVAQTCLARNQPYDVDDREGLIERIARDLGRKVLVIGSSQDEVPDHHIGMYLTPLGEGIVAVADPDLGEELYGNGRDERGRIEVEPDKTKYEPFRNVIRIMEAQGITVVRVPLVLTTTPRVYVTYNNAILETRNREKRIYMPVYDIPELDKAAVGIFEAQGWRVIPVSVSKVYGYTGSLRCLVGIISRK